MKVTKFVHSCLLVEEDNLKILIDPGHYSVEEEALKVESLNSLDYLLITHEHQDHMYVPFIKEVVGKFPEVRIISNESVVKTLSQEGINASIQGDENIELEEVPHEKLWDVEVPKNVKFTIRGKFTDPGDSHHFQSDTPILALPIQAPWGSTAQAVELAVGLKPRVIIPIHDWHWNDKARVMMYKRLEEYFEKEGIKFIPPETGEAVEIDL